MGGMNVVRTKKPPGFVLKNPPFVLKKPTTLKCTTKPPGGFFRTFRGVF